MQQVSFFAVWAAVMGAASPASAIQQLGVNIHTTAPAPGEAGLIRSTGFGTVRMDLHWHDTETRPGHYDFTPYDRLIAALDVEGIRPLLILNYGHPFYDDGRAPGSPEARAAFSRWAAAAVARYRGRGILWEIYNEPNLAHFWKPTPNSVAYVELVRATVTAIREVAPGETILGPATSGVDLAFLEACFRLGLLDYLDAVTVHPYRHHEPESVLEDYRRLRALIARYAPDGREIPILCGEWGYSAAWEGFDERKQALMLSRLFLANAAGRIPLTIWYDWRNDGSTATEPEHNFGLLARQGSPKAAWRAAATLARELDGFEFHMRLETGRSGEFVLLFKSSGGVKLAAWTTSPRPRRVVLPVSAGLFRAADWLGVELPLLNASAGGLDLTLTTEPVFLSPVAFNEALAAAAQWDALPLTIWVHAPAEVEISTNLVARKVEVLRNGGQRSGCLDLDLGGGGSWRQCAWLEVENALDITLTPQALLLAKSTGDAEETQVRAGAHQAQVSLPEGPAAQWYTFPGRITQGGAEVLDPLGNLLARSADTRFTPAGSLETASLLYDGNQSVPASAQVSSSCPGGAPEGACSTVLLDIAAGSRFIRFGTGRREIPADAAALGVWVHGDASGAFLRLRFVDSTGQTFQPAGVSVTWLGWRWIEIPVRGDAARSASWGGAGDGEPHGALSLDTLLLIDKPGPAAINAQISIGSLVWVERRE